MDALRDALERQQIVIYFCAVALAGAAALFFAQTARLEAFINPALALMLYATFLQVPMTALGRAFRQLRFMVAIFIANFVIIPLLVAGLLQLTPADPILRLGVLLVLMAPCIDYVITFAQLGRADARLLLAATPALLILQMLLLPFYLAALLGEQVRGLMQIQPFVQAFLWLIITPLILAGFTQKWVADRPSLTRITAGLRLLPVPATALVLFVVVAGVVPRLGAATQSVLRVIPVYVAFAAIAPMLGWWVARSFGVETRASRAVAFSSGTRNSLVVLPLAFAVPGALPVLPAVIVAQTLVELLAQLAYVRLIARLGPN